MSALPYGVFTAIDDVRACEVREADSYLAATSGGLIRVSGGKVEQVWTVLDGLPDTKTNALLVEGSAGNEVWVGTDRGLAQLKLTGAAITVVRTFAGAPVRAMARSNGNLYVGTYGDGVMKLAAADATSLTNVPFGVAKGSPARLRVTSLTSLDGELVAGTAGAGLFRLHGGALATLPMPPLVELTSVFALAVRDGRLYAGGVAGALSLGKDGVARSESKADVRAFTVIGDELWGAAYGEGLLRVGKGAVGTTLVAGVPAGAKWAQAFDASGEARCLGAASGLFVSKAGGAWTKIATSGLPSNDVNVIARDGERLWVGTYDKGLALFAGGTWKTISGPSLDDRINALAVQKKVAWVGTTRGLVKIDGATQTTFDTASGLPSSDVHALFALSTGGMLVGTTRGAAIVDGNTVTPLAKKQGLVIDTAWAVAEGPSGMLLVGASTGLYVRAAKQTKWKRLSVMTGHLPDDWVTALAVHGTDVLVGTYSGGVARLSLEGDDLVAGPASKLGGGYVNLAGLTISGDSLYAATMEGLLVRSLSAPGGSTGWKKLPRSALGVDVTGVVAGPDGLWVASRRGLVHTK